MDDWKRLLRSSQLTTSELRRHSQNQPHRPLLIIIKMLDQCNSDSPCFKSVQVEPVGAPPSLSHEENRRLRNNCISTQNVERKERVLHFSVVGKTRTPTDVVHLPQGVMPVLSVLQFQELVVSASLTRTQRCLRTASPTPPPSWPTAPTMPRSSAPRHHAMVALSKVKASDAHQGAK